MYHVSNTRNGSMGASAALASRGTLGSGRDGASYTLFGVESLDVRVTAARSRRTRWPRGPDGPSQRGLAQAM